MIQDASDLLRVLWLPVAVLAAAALLLAPPLAILPQVAALPAYLVHGAALIGAFFAWRFGRSRAVFALIAVALVEVTLVDAPPGQDAVGQVLYPAVALLAPLNLALIGCLDERGVATLSGASRLAVLVAWLVGIAGPGVQRVAADLLHLRLFPAEVDRWTWLTQPALIAFAAAAVVLGIKTWRSRTPLDAGLLGALAGIGLALDGVGGSPAPELFAFAAVLCLVLAVVQESYRMAFVDELTGLPGRRALSLDIKKLNRHYAVAMVDIDRFKSVNDTYGHAIGDQILKLVGAALHRSAGGARAYRYGGEEFTLLFPGLDAEAALAEAERVRQGVAASPFKFRGRDRPMFGARRRGKDAAKPLDELSVTVSIGVAEQGDGGILPEDVLKAADLALYGAKRAGRNQVMRYRPRRQRAGAKG
jgi:GGDEF domain-containing protein